LRLFAQLSWYFRREWRRYLGAIALLAIIAVLQLIPPKVVGIVVDGVTRQHYTAEKVWMWIGALVLIAVMVYLLRYVWRVLLLAPLISWPWSCGRTFIVSSAVSIRPFTCATAPAT
jgi:ATP-binding cassette subfamily B multidrug efflux pump